MAITPTDDRYRDHVIRGVFLQYDNGGGTAVNEVQTVTVTGTPTGGTFTLTFGGQTTAGIAFNATAAAVDAALEALSSVGAGDVAVTGAAGGPYTVTFTGALAGTDVGAITADGSGLTGGTTPSVTVATTTAGVQTGVGEVELDARAVNFDETVSTLRTEGTNDTYETDSTDRLQFTIDQSVFQQALEQIALPGATGVAGVTRRSWYSGDFDINRYYGLRMLFHAVDIDDGASVRFNIVVPKCSVRRYNPMQGGATRKAITPQQLILLAIKTTTNVAGDPIADAGVATMPEGGVFFYRDKMS